MREDEDATCITFKRRRRRRRGGLQPVGRQAGLAGSVIVGRYGEWGVLAGLAAA